MTTSITTGSTTQPVLSSDRVLWLYAATIFTSAFLLFSVQPIFAKMLLPVLGGAPAVWAVSMCFFQAMLLAGYAYAHLLIRFAPRDLMPAIHGVVLAAALLALPFGLPAHVDPPENPSYLWLMGTLTLGVGLPFFAVSANAPLLQAWFARTNHRHAGDPYFLYGASNVGSLLALLAYPFAVEPWLGLPGQAAAWTSGYVMLVVLIGCSGLAMIAIARRSTSAETRVATAAPPASLRQRLAWVGLSFVPSGLLTALTTHIATDIASMPLIWVLPLALYLTTFMIAFRDDPLISDRWLSRAAAPAATLALLMCILPGLLGLVATITAALGTFFILVTLNHRELYRRRPDVTQLTEFYFWMSLGGVLGGAACSLLAPQILNSTIEYPLLLAAAVAGQAAILRRPTADEIATTKKIGIGVAMAIVPLLLLFVLPFVAVSAQITATLVLLTLTGAAILLNRHVHIGLVLTIVAVLVFATTSRHQGLLTQQRGFFGVVQVADNGSLRKMVHGTTIHGVEPLRRDASGRPIPASYYHRENPIARGLSATREASPPDSRFRVGMVGLGVGAMACFAKPGESWRFYEIDPLVVKIATDPAYFTYLSSCPVSDGIKLGDARLTVQKEPEASFDYLLIDAFSSDVVPVHLMTKEALQTYVARLKPKGVLALHVSSRYLDLDTVAAATAASIPGAKITRVAHTSPFSLQKLIASPTEKDLDDMLEHPSSIAVFITRNEDMNARLRALPGAAPGDGRGVTPWSDSYADVLGSMIRFAKR